VRRSEGGSQKSEDGKVRGSEGEIEMNLEVGMRNAEMEILK
jgi:hypothetical protein